MRYPETGSPAGPRAGATEDVTAPTILIVDDDRDMRLYLPGCLRGLGEAPLSVIDAADGVEALRRVRRDGVTMVICDVVLPEMDGLALLQAIRADPLDADLAVLLISGVPKAVLLSGPEDAVRGKPFNAR
jgi:CheY-like chemotaxis protein